MKKYTILPCIFVFLISGCEMRHRKEIPKVETKYTINVGTASFSLGYDVDEYEIKDGFLNTKVGGKEIVFPLNSIFSIKTNN